MTFCSGQLLYKNSSRGYKSRLNHVFDLLFPGTIRSDLGDNLSGWNRLIGLLFLPFTRWVTLFRLCRLKKCRAKRNVAILCLLFLSVSLLHFCFLINYLFKIFWWQQNHSGNVFRCQSFFFIHAYFTQVCILRCSDDPSLCSRWRCCGTQWWILLWLCQARVVSSRQRRGNGEETVAGKCESYKTCVNGRRLLFVSPITPCVGS